MTKENFGEDSCFDKPLKNFDDTTHLSDTKSNTCFHSSTISDSLNTVTTDANVSDDTAISNLIIYKDVQNRLSAVIATEASVHYCTYCLQKEYGESHELRKKCLESVTTFFLTVDDKSRCNAFYVLNDLVQYDSRFRLLALQIVLPSIAYAISGLSNQDLYVKTVNVWRERNIFPKPVCDAIQMAFTSVKMHYANIKEFESCLKLLTQFVETWWTQKKAIDTLLGETEVTVTSDGCIASAKAASAILAASNTELDLMHKTISGALIISKELIEFVACLLLNFHEAYSKPNNSRMRELLVVVNSMLSIKSLHE